MARKLYAGYDDGLYEYAVWSSSNHNVALVMGLPLWFVKDKFRTQGRQLVEVCPDNTKAYRRDLGHDENPWQIWKEAK